MDYQTIIISFIDNTEKYISDITNINIVEKLIINNIYVNNQEYTVYINIPSNLNDFLIKNSIVNNFNENLGIIFNNLFPYISYNIKLENGIIILVFNQNSGSNSSPISSPISSPNSSPSTKSKKLTEIPYDIIKEILYLMKYDDILKFCATNKEYSKFCNDEKFWHILLLRYINNDEIKQIWKESYRDTFRFYSKIMIENRYASIHTTSFNEDEYLDGNGLIDYLLKENKLKIILVRRGDILENQYESGYRSEGVSMIDIVDGKIKIVGYETEQDDYGSPYKNFTYPDFPADYWNYDKINIIGGKPMSYWHSDPPPVKLNENITNKKYYACIIDGKTIPWYMTFNYNRTSDYDRTSVYNRTFNYNDDKYILFLNSIEDDKIISNIVEISSDSLMQTSYDILEDSKYPEYIDTKLKDLDLYVYSFNRSFENSMSDYEKQIYNRLNISEENCVKYFWE